LVDEDLFKEKNLCHIDQWNAEILEKLVA